MFKGMEIETFIVRSPYEGCYWEPQVAITVETDEGNAHYWVGNISRTRHETWNPVYTGEHIENEIGQTVAVAMTVEQYETMRGVMGERDYAQRIEYDAAEKMWRKTYDEGDDGVNEIGQRLEVALHMPLKYALTIMDAIEELRLEASAEWSHPITELVCAVCNAEIEHSWDAEPYDYEGDNGIGINVESYRCRQCVDDEEEWFRAGDRKNKDFPPNEWVTERDWYWNFHPFTPWMASAVEVNGVTYEFWVEGSYYFDITVRNEDEEVLFTIEQIAVDEKPNVFDILVMLEEWFAMYNAREGEEVRDGE